MPSCRSSSCRGAQLSDPRRRGSSPVMGPPEHRNRSQQVAGVCTAHPTPRSFPQYMHARSGQPLAPLCFSMGSTRNVHPPLGEQSPHAMHCPPHPMQPAPSCSRPSDPCNRTAAADAGECDCACACVVMLCAYVIRMCDALCGRTMTLHLAAGPRAPGTIRWASGRCG